jgi:trehalose/maltose hydrolase-like predicted phosphorylase
MPNWCENEVTFTGDAEKVQKIKDFVKGKERDFCFEKIVPMPKEIKNTTASNPSKHTPEQSKKLISKYGFDNWYDWCIENWDTKWNATDVEMEDDEDRVTYQFLTAWCPP